MYSRPTSKARGKLVQQSEKQFKKSDESAYSIVPSRMSVSTSQTNHRNSSKSEEELVYRRLSFENDLFTSRVYKRNYRSPMLLGLLNAKPRHIPANINPRARAESTRISRFRADRPDSVISQGQKSIHGGSVQSAHLPLAPIEHFHEAESQDEHLEEDVLVTFDPASEPLTKPSDESETSVEDVDDDETLHPQSALLIRGPVRPVRQYSNPVNEELSWTFLNACSEGNYDTVSKLLGTGLDVPSLQKSLDSHRFGALNAAVLSGHIDIVRILLKHGAWIEHRPNSNSSRPLHVAAQQGNASMVQLLLDYGAQINAENRFREQPIHLAATFNSIEVLRVLIDKGAALDCLNQDGRQPIHMAAKFGSTGAVFVLLHKGATFDCLDQDGRQPIHLAAKYGSVRTLRALLDKGATVDCLDQDGRQPIHLAAKYGSIEIIHALLDKGATLDCWDRDGRQPLHCAANWLDRPNVIEFLVEAGADIDAGELHKRPLNFACRANCDENVRALINLGAEIDDYPSVLRTAIEHGWIGALGEHLERGHSRRISRTSSP